MMGAAQALSPGITAIVVGAVYEQYERAAANDPTKPPVPRLRRRL